MTPRAVSDEFHLKLLAKTALSERRFLSMFSVLLGLAASSLCPPGRQVPIARLSPRARQPRARQPPALLSRQASRCSLSMRCSVSMVVDSVESTLTRMSRGHSPPQYRYDLTRGARQLSPRRHTLHVSGARTRLGRAVRTAYRGTTGGRGARPVLWHLCRLGRPRPIVVQGVRQGAAPRHPARRLLRAHPPSSLGGAHSSLVGGGWWAGWGA